MSVHTREELHAILDTVLDAQETAWSANDPVRAAEGKDKAFALGMKFVKALLGDLLAERMRAARLVRAYLQPSSPWAAASLEAAQGPVAPAAMHMDRGEAAQQRWMVARFFADFADLMQPGLASNFVGALLSLNLGVENPLLRPLRIKGLGPGPTVLFQFSRTLLAYYRAGYRSAPLEQVLQDDAGMFGGISPEGLKSAIHRLRIGELATNARAAGAADKAAGRPEKPNNLACQDFIAFVNATKGK